jgi:hypothetical protein
MRYPLSIREVSLFLDGIDEKWERKEYEGNDQFIVV